MSITATDVKNTVNSEFDSISDSVVEDYITLAQAELNDTIWGDRYDRASVLLTRHMLALEMQTTSASSPSVGPVTSLATGPVRITYGSTSTSSSSSLGDLSKTIYGEQLYTLMMKTIPRICVI